MRKKEINKTVRINVRRKITEGRKEKRTHSHRQAAAAVTPVYQPLTARLLMVKPRH
ncbi:hypothetical protein ESA_01319 [Cronobacter sakazakii ATCC BAA-894]|uniref:Uncharacterized protein n=1 Tax=Cronobacter sakazakii (strain ATCC BAA-894) TaxID=290339 RepID=A7MJF8_CROS8|nr:hypothetical protein ESA_01319 [Cronobacter sakazakii ATCC BAA-894]